MKKISAIALSIFMILGSFAGCSDKGDTTHNKEPIKGERASSFENKDAYKLPEYKPQVKPYKIEKGLSNVKGIGDLELSDRMVSLIEKNGFAVDLSEEEMEFFMVYEQNRYSGRGNFITTDSMVHNYHLYFDYLLRTIEKKHLYGKLKDLTESMLKSSVDQYEKLKGTEFEDAALKNISFFAVPAELMDLNTAYPKKAEPYVDKEIDLIEKHEGITDSIVLNLNIGEGQDSLLEDYSQYTPRGHYVESKKLKEYFKAMMWYGRASLLKANDNDMYSALLMTMAVNNEEAKTDWYDIYDVTSFFAGKSDDLSMDQTTMAVKEVFGKIPDVSDIKDKGDKVKEVIGKFKDLEGNKINSIPVKEDADLKETTNSIRFMGQRYSIDAEIFQNLIYRKVGENNAGEKRMLPKSLDIAAAFGSKLAESILEKKGDKDYENYESNLNKLKEKVKAIPKEAWKQDLYWGWMYFLKPLLEETEEGYPKFMQNEAWKKKQLNTFVSSWTELKHNTILYSKQVMAEMGDGPIDEEEGEGYVEPAPVLYNRLANLCKMTSEGLDNLGILDEKEKKNLKIMEDLSIKLMEISIKELENKELSSKEKDLIKSYGGQLEHFWIESISDKEDKSIFNNQASLVADVATDPNGEVLEEGNGYVKVIYVAVPINGKLKLLAGGVFSNYEFKQPISERLDDNSWNDMLMDLGQYGIETHDWVKDYSGM